MLTFILIMIYLYQDKKSKGDYKMTKDFEAIARKESPSIKKLLEARDAYVASHKALRTAYDDEASATWVLMTKVTFDALKLNAKLIAEKGEAGQDFLSTLDLADETSLPWHDILHLMVNTVPAVSAYFEKVMGDE